MEKQLFTFFGVGGTRLTKFFVGVVLRKRFYSEEKGKPKREPDNLQGRDNETCLTLNDFMRKTEEPALLVLWL